MTLTLRARVVAVAIALLTALALAVAMSASPDRSVAHDHSYCQHYNVNPAGGWYVVYLGHYTTTNGNHYNVYDDYLYGAWEHQETNRCN